MRKVLCLPSKLGTYYKINKIGKGIGLNISIYMANICNICILNTYVFTSTKVSIFTLTSTVNMKLAVRCVIHRINTNSKNKVASAP